MCGIAGYFSPRNYPPEILAGMVNRLYHRGPDADGFFGDGAYHAGMRRLSINDVEGGDQPLTNADRSVVLLYNGEIYNSPELRRQLEQDGVLFRTHSDGEVICFLYEREGERAFELLDGMFAAALWDARERKLILARDIPGEKPLYFAVTKAGELVFGSEIASVIAFPGVERKLNRQALWDFPTFLWIPEPDTIYENVRAVPPGHILAATEHDFNIRPFANRFGSGIEIRNDGEAIEVTRFLVENAVKSRLLSDVPVGCFLSSGLDSSLVTTIASRHLPELSTFTIGFEDVDDPYHGKADESPFSESYAGKLGTKHHTVRVTADDFRGNLDLFTRHAGQPFAVSSGLGILSIAQAAREHGIKVLLSGDGADEAFGGYSWYEHFRRMDRFAPVNESPVPREPVSMQYLSLPQDRLIASMRSYPPALRAWAWHYYASESDKARLFADEPFRDVRDSLRHFENFKNDSPWSPEDTIRQDRHFYFPNEMLQKVDRMTMAASVEGRVPFAAPAIQSLADKLSYPQMVRGSILKWVLRQAFRDTLDSEIVSRPKHGFNVPIDYWLNGKWSDLVTKTFAPSSALTRFGLADKNALKTAQYMLSDSRRLTGHTVFCYIQLNHWLEQAEGVTL